MEFTWDPAKRADCLVRRRIDFQDAARIFDGRVLERIDQRWDYGEVRVIAIGRSAGSSLPGGATPVSARRTRKPAKIRERPGGGRTDWEYLRNMTEEEIEAQVPEEYRDLPEDFWDDAVLVMPGPKQPISLRVDEDVLAWFKQQGPRYQTRMNAVLRAYMQQVGSKPRRKPAGRREGPGSRR